MCISKWLKIYWKNINIHRRVVMWISFGFPFQVPYINNIYSKVWTTSTREFPWWKLSFWNHGSNYQPFIPPLCFPHRHCPLLCWFVLSILLFRLLLPFGKLFFSFQKRNFLSFSGKVVENFVMPLRSRKSNITLW